MFKRLVVFFFSGFLLLNIYGCFALLAGAVGGAGTAVWLSGKLTQEFNASYLRTVGAAESAMKSLDLKIEKKTEEMNVTAFRSHYTDGKEVWIDVRRIAEASTKVEVRVGAVKPDKGASAKILNKIKEYL